MLGKRLKKLRNEQGLTQEQLGKIINVTKVSISGYENGNRTPDTETLQSLADYFEVSTDYLLGRTDKDSEEKTAEEIYEDPDFQYAMRSAQGLSEESKQKVFDFIEMMKEVEKARKNSETKNNK
ncbi:helix-turn-helix domain-containing protein [Lederbergia sp. NSJ-179]|uniref:helix-turn-helix domain-containing protein n=1 Tax=Lederbergia sp. NSJ-179 TaxID=2931402 RepID=UPI001FD413F2|nr:helix-turn-helix domain-containing protein [Lederbergia sp. NSJ-179]MCJ7840540.1 helix-turn-helix domain-containing protein [Lederbergia sp. NSJ-179]